MSDLDRMVAQGAVEVPGARRFYVGNILDFVSREKQAKDRQMAVHSIFLQDLIAKAKGDSHYRAHKSPVFTYNLLGTMGLFISDPDMVAELYTTK